MAKKDRHVISNPSGGWSVRHSGASRASRIFSTQADAVRYGRDLAKQERTGLYVHRRDGTIKQMDSYESSSSAAKGRR
jgi:hypothetical protein